MHVFARTKGGDPATYYHRIFSQERSWTPWDKVDLDITGDHLLAFMRNSRLYLAWPIFSEQANRDQSIKIPDPTALSGGKETDHAKKYYKVQIAISEFSGKKWLPKKLSKDALNTVEYEVLPSKQNFRFTLLQPGRRRVLHPVHLYRRRASHHRQRLCSNDNTVIGSFSLTGCKGVPEIVPWNAAISFFNFLPVFKDTSFLEQHFREMNQITGGRPGHAHHLQPQGLRAGQQHSRHLQDHLPGADVADRSAAPAVSAAVLPAEQV